MNTKDCYYGKTGSCINGPKSADCGDGCENYLPRTRTEIWTRVMGYHRPTFSFNPGKVSEHDERVHFKFAEQA